MHGNMSSSNNSILVVEDDRDIQYLYKFKLEHEGFNVSVASNGAQGLKFAEEIVPDLMLVDLLLPQMSGTDMLTAIRQHVWGSDIRVFILTNISRHEAPQALRFLHIDRFIVKEHSTPVQIVTAIREVLGQPKAVRVRNRAKTVY